METQFPLTNIFWDQSTICITKYQLDLEGINQFLTLGPLVVSSAMAPHVYAQNHDGELKRDEIPIRRIF